MHLHLVQEAFVEWLNLQRSGGVGCFIEAFSMDKSDRPVLLKEITPDNSWVFLVQLSDHLRSSQIISVLFCWPFFVAWSHVVLYKNRLGQVSFCRNFDRLEAKSLVDALWFGLPRRGEKLWLFFWLIRRTFAESTMPFRFADLDT